MTFCGFRRQDEKISRPEIGARKETRGGSTAAATLKEKMGNRGVEKRRGDVQSFDKNKHLSV